MPSKLSSSRHRRRCLEHQTIITWLLVALAFLSAFRVVASEAISVTKGIVADIASMRAATSQKPLN
jgi:hypothetical protein